MKCLALLPAALLLVSSGSAQVLSFDNTVIPGTLSDATAVKANVLSIDFAGQYTGTQVLLNLTQGSIINIDLLGAPNDVAPPSAAVTSKPDLGFDTYAAQGARFSDAPGADGSVGLGGGAVNIGADPSPIFDSLTIINQAWNPVASTDIFDRTNFVLAQISLTADAEGTFTFFTSAGLQFFTTGIDTVEYVVRGGEIVPIPEPAVAVLLGLGGLAMLRRRAG